MGVVEHRTRAEPEVLSWKGMMIYRVCGVGVVGLWVDVIKYRVKSTYQAGRGGTKVGELMEWGSRGRRIHVEFEHANKGTEKAKEMQRGEPRRVGPPIHRYSIQKKLFIYLLIHDRVAVPQSVDG